MKSKTLGVVDADKMGHFSALAGSSLGICWSGLVIIQGESASLANSFSRYFCMVVEAANMRN